MRVPEVVTSAPSRVTVGDEIPITMTLTNTGTSPMLAAVGDPNPNGRDWAFSLRVTRDGKSVTLPRREGRSGRAHLFEPGASTAIVTDLGAWVTTEPGRYDVDVAYALELHGVPRAALTTTLYDDYHRRWDATVSGSVSIVVQPE